MTRASQADLALQLGINDSDDDEEAFDAIWSDRTRGEWFHDDNTGLQTRLSNAVPRRNAGGRWDRPPGTVPGAPTGFSCVTWNDRRCAWEARADKRAAEARSEPATIRARHFCACWNEAVGHVERNGDLGKYLDKDECEWHIFRAICWYVQRRPDE